MRSGFGLELRRQARESLTAAYSRTGLLVGRSCDAPTGKQNQQHRLPASGDYFAACDLPQQIAVRTKKDEIRSPGMERLYVCCVFLQEREEISG